MMMEINVTAKREIEDLLVAMGSGKPIACSEELMKLCERFVHRLDADDEMKDVEDWAMKLASDLSKFAD